MTNQNIQMILENHPDLKDTSQIENLFRLIRYEIKKVLDGHYLYQATVYNSQATIKITWINTHDFAELNNGALVRVKWLTKNIFINGTNIVCSLERIKNLEPQDNLLSTIPNNWIPLKKYFNFFKTTLVEMDNQLARLIMHMLIDERTLYTFLNLPYTQHESKNKKGGNFIVTMMNLDFAMRGTHYQEFQTTKEIFKAAMIIIGITRHLMWMYDESNRRYFMPAKNKQMKLNILAARLINDTNQRYKLTLSAENAHEFDKLLRNKVHEQRLISCLW